MPATATVSTSVVVNYSKSVAGTNFVGSPKIDTTLTFSNTDISKVHTDTGTISTGTTTDVTAAPDAFGATLNFGTVKGFVLNNTHGSATITVGGGTNALFGTDQYTVKAGRSLVVTAPFIVDGTHKNILLTPSASCTYQLIVFGS